MMFFFLNSETLYESQIIAIIIDHLGSVRFYAERFAGFVHFSQFSPPEVVLV